MPDRVGAIIPAFRAGPRLAGVVRETRRHLDEVLVVDDGSGDGTGRDAIEAGARLLRHPANRGKGAALATGMAHALRHGWTAAVCLDGDGQHDPAWIPRLLEAWRRTRADVVVGSRMERPEGMPPARRATNRVTSRVVSWLARSVVDDCMSGFRLLGADALARVRCRSARYAMEPEFLIRAGRLGLRIVEVPIPPRYEGQESFIRPVRDTARFVRMVLRFV